jgi:ABC-2 type transport system ATP-binding protein
MITMNDAPQGGAAAARWDPGAARGQRGAAVEAVGLVKTYTGRGGTVEAVRGVDLRIEGGEIFGFLGPNGAGQVHDRPDADHAADDHLGHRPRRRRRRRRADPDGVRRRMGVRAAGGRARPAPDRPRAARPAGRLFGMAPRDAPTRAEELLQLVELEEAADRTVKGYSAA